MNWEMFLCWVNTASVKLLFLCAIWISFSNASFFWIGDSSYCLKYGFITHVPNAKIWGQKKYNKTHQTTSKVVEKSMHSLLKLYSIVWIPQWSISFYSLKKAYQFFYDTVYEKATAQSLATVTDDRQMCQNREPVYNSPAILLPLKFSF